MAAGDSAERDLKLDADGDLLFEGGDMVLDSGASSIVSDVRARLNTFRGEWFLDQEIGIPYFDDVLVKRPNLPAIRAIFRDAMLETPGIAEIVSMAFDYDGAQRRMTLKFRAATDTGELVTDAVEVGI